MTKIDKGMRIYTVVEVMRGVAAGAYTFRRLKDARMCATRLCKGRNLDEEDVQLFETTVNSSINPEQTFK